jgi:hypothetical protein
MKRRFSLIVLAGTALGIAFATGAVTAVKRGWGSPLVSVYVENNTKSQVRLVTLTYSSCGATHVLTTQNLSPGKDHTFKFPICGEGGYKIEAALDEGRILSSGAYVESGYATRETIEPTRIRSEYQIY